MGVPSDQVILLVEDNPDDVDLTLWAFKNNNIQNEIVVAGDGVEALDYLFCTGPHQGRDPHVRPAIILLDLKLPKVDGLEVLKRLRSDECCSLIPVVVLTSSKQEQDVLKSYELGANSYIRKPVDFRQFTEVVRNLGIYWLQLNEPPPPLDRDY